MGHIFTISWPVPYWASRSSSWRTSIVERSGGQHFNCCRFTRISKMRLSLNCMATWTWFCNTVSIWDEVRQFCWNWFWAAIVFSHRSKRYSCLFWMLPFFFKINDWSCPVLCLSLQLLVAREEQLEHHNSGLVETAVRRRVWMEEEPKEVEPTAVLRYCYCWVLLRPS